MAFVQFSRKIFSTALSKITSSSLALPAAAPGSMAVAETGLTAGGGWATIFNRTNVRNNFPRAKETKRIRTHGWEKRLQSEGGRRIIMRRILKGRHVLSH